MPLAKGNLYRERSIEATRLHQGTLSETKRRIAKLYEEAAADIVLTKGRAKSSLTRQWANSYAKELRSRVNEIWQEVGDITYRGMEQAANRALGVQLDWLNDAASLAGLDLRSRFADTFGHTPDEAVAAVIQGKLYSGPTAMLSKRIWNNAAIQSGKLEQIILQAVAKQQSPVELEKALRAYVNPKAFMPDNWNDIYEDCPFVHRCEYNAKRLAVTSMNHAWFSATIMLGRQDPFAIGLQWELSSFHTIYDVCDTYMEHDEGLGIGVYSFDNAPIPHPFCRCTWYPATKSLDEIAKELYRWEQGESNPRLDRDFGAFKNSVDQFDSRVRLNSEMQYSEAGPFMIGKKETVVFGSGSDIIVNGSLREGVVYITPSKKRIIYPTGYNKARQKIRPHRMQRVIEKLPETLKEYVRNVYVVDYYNPFDAFWQRKYKDFSHSYASAGARGITFFRNDKTRVNEKTVFDVLVHEIGHVIDLAFAASGKNFSEGVDWTAARASDTIIAGSSSVTEYGINSPHEDFAESVKLYVQNPDRFAKLFPNRYRLLKGVIGL